MEDFVALPVDMGTVLLGHAFARATELPHQPLRQRDRPAVLCQAKMIVIVGCVASRATMVIVRQLLAALAAERTPMT